MFMIECETAGKIGNQEYGLLLPIDYINGLERAEITDVLIAGEDEESDETLRQRYFDAVNEQPFGGNISDYKTKINAIDGVGGVKVFPAWNGGGTVKTTIIAADFSQPTPTLVGEVQTIIDPEVNKGQGIGLAPIGHQVTVTGAKNFAVNVSATLTLSPGTTLGQVQSDIEEAVKLYLQQLRQRWANEPAIIIRVVQIEARILTVPSVLDISNTKLNGSTSNITLTDEQIPVIGTVTLSE